ncbi:MAG: hypothetical protein D6712_09930 [Chloroflexi bacterium]|nr:MAG: hypothetical protein D6712_09930 [Chloroflexota bacterium]
MPIDVRWYDDQQTILHMSENGAWTWDDFYAARQQADEMLKQVAYKAHVIIEATHGNIPSNAMTHFRASRMSNHGLTVLVGPRAFSRIMYNVYLRIAGKQHEASFRMASTIEEALDIIAEWEAVNELKE